MLTESAIKDVTRYGFECGKSLRRIYGSKDAHTIATQSQRVRSEATDIMAALYGKRFTAQIAKLISTGILEGYTA